MSRRFSHLLLSCSSDCLPMEMAHPTSFLEDRVMQSCNNHERFGHVHGPYSAKGKFVYIHQHHPSICMATTSTGRMCGEFVLKRYDGHLSFKHHLETQHSTNGVGGIQYVLKNDMCLGFLQDEQIWAKNVLYRFVCTGQWRMAHFDEHVTSGPPEIETIVTEVEMEAATNPGFAKRYPGPYRRSAYGNIPPVHSSNDTGNVDTPAIKDNTAGNAVSSPQASGVKAKEEQVSPQQTLVSRKRKRSISSEPSSSKQHAKPSKLCVSPVKNAKFAMKGHFSPGSKRRRTNRQSAYAILLQRFTRPMLILDRQSDAQLHEDANWSALTADDEEPAFEKKPDIGDKGMPKEEDAAKKGCSASNETPEMSRPLGTNRVSNGTDKHKQEWLAAWESYLPTI